MRLDFVDIRNFRRLKRCRVELSERTTLCVGANNSGKTSAMNALILFLGGRNRPRFSVTDFTLCNWRQINAIGNEWERCEEPGKLDFSPVRWHQLVPSLDVWLYVDESEIHYVSNILPTLDWNGGLLGLRLVYEPKDIERLYRAHIEQFHRARNTERSSNVKLWPGSLYDFLKQELDSHFTVKAYILDPEDAKPNEPASTQRATIPVDGNPLTSLVKVDFISAQRGFSDPSDRNPRTHGRRLSEQLRDYFRKHLDPLESPDVSDIEALAALENARDAFERQLHASFKGALDELTELNYPGFNNPEIHLTARLDPLQPLDHDAAVQFKIASENGSTSPDQILVLPEDQNGLGYQNLISMVFSLIRFRDEWMRVGKAGKSNPLSNDQVEPLHLVMVEEPEVHLHPQAQQVFARKAYDILRKHERLTKNSKLSTQLIVSTHSSHITHELNFSDLRYFKRRSTDDPSNVPFSTVVNMSETFGGSDDTDKFVTRYLKSTHCDLFFADAVILVEGASERMLVPHFIRKHYPQLNTSYVSILEISGSHAHRLRPLIEKLGILTLIITDLDSAEPGSGRKMRPQKNRNLVTTNPTIKLWVPGKDGIDEILEATPESRTIASHVRVEYPCELRVDHYGMDERVIPYTFEDALALANISLFKQKTESTGLLKKMALALNTNTAAEACANMFGCLTSGAKKAELALELLVTTDPSVLNPPKYIHEGLSWLQSRLDTTKQRTTAQSEEEEQNAIGKPEVLEPCVR